MYSSADRPIEHPSQGGIAWRAGMAVERSL
jgi:hypothetical protein